MLNLSKLLGRKLKDEETLDVLETCGIDKVVYDFDRRHENMSGVYWAGSEAEGFLLRFNDRQICDVIFCYIHPAKGFRAVDPEWIGVTTYRSYAEAERVCLAKGLSYSVAGPARAGAWLRVDTGDFKAHYQFTDGALSLVTLSSDVPTQSPEWRAIAHHSAAVDFSSSCMTVSRETYARNSD